MSKKTKIITLGCLLIVVGAVYVGSNFYSIYGNRRAKISLAGQVFRVEIADSAEEKKLGLGGRKNICSGCGMLFIFSESGRHSFWMKDMEFPLDILWLEKGSIVEMEKNIPADSKEIFSPVGYSDQVLELEAGTVDRLGIGKGDEVILN